MTDFFPQIEIFRKWTRGGISRLKIGLLARTRIPPTRIFFLVRRNLLSPNQKKNTEKQPVDRWNSGVFPNGLAARLNVFNFGELT